jgi:hypothetical protein
VDQARADWNKNLRANQVTRPLQKMTDNDDGRAGGLNQLRGDESANALVEDAENARDALQEIKNFVPKSATGQQAYQKILANNTTQKAAITRLGIKATAPTDWNGVVKDLGNLSPEQRQSMFKPGEFERVNQVPMK